MRRLIALAALAVPALAPAARALTPPNCPAPQPESNMTTTLLSDFAKTGVLDPTQWRPFVGQHGTTRDELQAFVADQVTVAKSVGLRLQTDRQERWGHKFVSGEVTTQGLFAQTYGHFEVVARMPQANGLWPALWLLPENGAWPPEIDIVEYIYAPWGKLPDRTRHMASNPQTTLHWKEPSGGHGQMGQGFHSDVQYFGTFDDWNTTTPPRGLGETFKGYHRYAVDWRPGSVSWFIDDAAVFCVIDGPGTGKRVPDQPMFMILDDAVTSGTPDHPGWPGYLSPDQQFPQSVDIASVRAARFKDLPPPPPMPLDIRSVKLSASSVRAGQTVRIDAVIQVGDADLGSARDAKVTLRKFDMTQYYGIGAPVASIPLQLSRLSAGQRYPVSASYAVSPLLPTGLYSVGLNLGYSSGPPTGAGHFAGLEQIGTIKVTN
jgi:beta-glucanase (GH16 family)